MGSLATAAGQAMLAAGAAIILIGLAATVPRTLGVRRRALRLQRTVQALGYDLRAELELLASRREEANELLAPWRKVWRVARHPLVLAAFRWYRRRRRRAHERASAATQE
ncbi:MAG TPA: hypothetical protein VKF14_13465 [Candidatus Dormibacteraeota bacterium]|nr:hypothetical protein [Candidatus Dormibacteraeota bacterium]